MRIVLIACASKKLEKQAKAKNLYISDLFKLGYKYALSLKPDKIFILSAKYGLISIDEEIKPYNKTLNKMSKNERQLWSENVLQQLKKQANIEKDKFIFLAGKKYREALIPHMKNYKIPLQGLGIGKQLQFLKNKTENLEASKKCDKLHKIFNNLKIHRFPFNEDLIPKNGIYILFEQGEKAHGTNRIVRIGTHTGKDQLRSRLNQHFVNENKDRSIFRKNIGRAILNQKKDPYLKIWEIDFTTKQARQNLGSQIDYEKQKQIEKQVTKYIQNNFFFSVIKVGDANQKKILEEKIISTISLCTDCSASPSWFGQFSPLEKIRKSGLWLIQGLYKNPLSDKEIEEIEKSTTK